MLKSLKSYQMAVFWIFFTCLSTLGAQTLDYEAAQKLYEEGASFEASARTLAARAALEKENLDRIRWQIEQKKYPPGESQYSLVEQYKKQQLNYEKYAREAEEKYLQMSRRYEAAFAEFVRLEKKNPNRDDLMFYIASMYDTGKGVAPYQSGKPFSPDALTAYKWYLKAADLGNFVAQYNLASYFYDGRPGFPVNIKEAFFWYSVAAGEQALPGKRVQKVRYAPALYMLGKMYLQGQAVKRNTQVGLDYLTMAAKDLYAPAAAELGMFLMYGSLEVPKDPKRSLHYLVTAAEGGHSETLAQLGKMLHLGDPFVKNRAAALVLYNLAYFHEKDPAQSAKYKKSLDYMLDTLTEEEYQLSQVIAEQITADGMFYYVLTRLLQFKK